MSDTVDRIYYFVNNDPNDVYAIYMRDRDCTDQIVEMGLGLDDATSLCARMNAALFGQWIPSPKEREREMMGQLAQMQQSGNIR